MLLRALLIILVCLLTVARPAPAQAESLDVKTFAQLPIMHEGRLKPMESFARANLKALSGRDAHASEWLMEVLFNPALAEKRPALKIANPEVLNFLSLTKGKPALFSYKEVLVALLRKRQAVASLLQAPEESLTPAQKDLLLLQQKVALLGDLLSSLSLYVPLSIQLPAVLPKDLQPYAGRKLSYIDSLKLNKALGSYLSNIIKKKAEDLKKYNKNELQLTYFAFALANLRVAGQNSKNFRVVPSARDKTWLSPWTLIESGQGSPHSVSLFNQWKQLTEAYHRNDQNAWKASAKEIYKQTTQGRSSRISTLTLKIETFYHGVRPFGTSALFYGAALLFLLATFFYSKEVRLYKLASYALWGGVMAHALGIIMRLFILQRPPVSTLYESVLFVALIVVLYGLLAHRQHGDVFWLYISAGAGLLLQILAVTQNQAGDSLLLLTAVLNTNFWLATHVICITAGYGFCIVTSMLGHYILFKSWRENKKTPDKTLFQHLHKAALLSLLFCAVGTVLGGIWADQSWGRFWGWDPKENGALLIVLWLIWVLHGRVSGQMSNLLVSAALAYLSVIVALSWFGVNLLGVGLHSYGFTDSATLFLVLLIGLESLLIGGAYWRIGTGAPHAPRR